MSACSWRGRRRARRGRDVAGGGEEALGGIELLRVAGVLRPREYGRRIVLLGSERGGMGAIDLLHRLHARAGRCRRAGSNRLPAVIAAWTASAMSASCIVLAAHFERLLQVLQHRRDRRPMAASWASACSAAGMSPLAIVACTCAASQRGLAVAISASMPAVASASMPRRMKSCQQACGLVEAPGRKVGLDARARDVEQAAHAVARFLVLRVDGQRLEHTTRARCRPSVRASGRGSCRWLAKATRAAESSSSAGARRSPRHRRPPGCRCRSRCLCRQSPRRGVRRGRCGRGM